MKTDMINNSANKYSAIDGLRAYSAIGIVMMHVLANGGYELGGLVFERLIPSFTNFVFLFMVISGFSMCCGYYDKILNNTISMVEFYKKRFVKVWPFFALLCVLDVVVSPNLNSIYELFANLTLCFGLLPNAGISVIGVGWFLGLVFAFYFMFPFFCVLLSTKRSAWISLIVAVIFNYLCTNYFFDSNHVIEQYSSRVNIVYCFCFFLLGGIIYLYRKKLEQWSREYKWLFLGGCCVSVIFYYLFEGKVLILLLLSAMLLIYAIGCNKKGVLVNVATQKISKLSLEIYLSHMLMYRILEKLRLIHLFESELLSYIFISSLTIIGTICFVVVVRYGLKVSARVIRRGI